MKVSDYIVEYLISKKITDVFGYPGGMVTHLMESFRKYKTQISAHLMYHEQGAAFAACGYAQSSGKVGVAYATSGPGATNLITGICNAYFDSIPTLFLTGQVNTFESKGDLTVRQRGFQETDIVSMITDVTKYACTVDNPVRIRWYLDYAFWKALSGRKGPVLLDIPINIFRSEINPEELEGYTPSESYNIIPEEHSYMIWDKLSIAKRPVLIIGNGVKISNSEDLICSIVHRLAIPVISTMLAVDVLANNPFYYGFIGAYGDRTANFIAAKSDLIIALGARLDVRQVGAKRENFAPDATIIRVDIDEGELQYKVREDEIQICTDVRNVLDGITHILNQHKPDFYSWISVCNTVKETLNGYDERRPNVLMSKLSQYMHNGTIVTTDVGQNQVWAAQSLKIKDKQKVFFSGGHGAMGYSLPAAIGCCLASKNTVYSINGDGGFQMNIQEMQMIFREKLPIQIIIFNNSALGMIRHFQEMYFSGEYYQTIPQGGYTVPDFGAIAEAYGIPYKIIENESQIDELIFRQNEPCLIEVRIPEDTYVFPKLEFGKPNQDQEPLLNRELYERLMQL